MKLFCSRKDVIDKTKNWENVPSLKVVEVVLVQFNLLDNQYQQTSENFYAKEILCKIIIIFTDQNGGPLERKNKVNLTSLINK